MSLKCLLLGLFSTVLFSSVASAADPPPDEVLAACSTVQQAMARKDPPVTGCGDLNTLWFSLPVSLDVNNPLRPRCDSVRARLLERRRFHKCLVRGPGESPTPTPQQELNNYRTLRASVEAQRTACMDRKECPKLREDEQELGRLAAHLLRVLPPSSPEGLEIEGSLSVVFGAGIDNQELIHLLQTRRLSDQEQALLYERLVSKDPKAAAKVLGFLKALKDQELTDVQAAEIVKAATDIVGGRKFDPSYLARLTEVAAMLNDHNHIARLRQMLELLGERYGNSEGLKTKTTKALEELRQASPDPTLIAEAFNGLDPVILAQLEREVSVSNLTTQPADPKEYAANTSPVLVYGREALLATRCAAGPSSNAESGPMPERAPGDAFLAKVVRTLNFTHGPKSGFRPFLATPEGKEVLSTLKRSIGRITRLPNEAPECNRTKPVSDERLGAIYDQLCAPPYPAVFLFEMSLSDGVVTVSGTWWEGSVPQAMNPISFHADCSEHEELAGLRTAQNLAERISLFKDHEARKHPREAHGGQPTTASPWLAAAFAGAPYIADSRSATAPKWIFSILDGGLIAGSVGSTALAFKYRNDYSAGRKSSLDPANTAMNAALILAGGALVTRVVSGVLHEAWPAAWQRSEAK
jgi:hypothetical protein